jgi:hypothetical protein
VATKILLVDDDEMQNIIMRKLLEREGFDTTVAGSVAEVEPSYRLRHDRRTHGRFHNRAAERTGAIRWLASRGVDRP